MLGRASAKEPEAEAKTRSGSRKPFVSANSRLSENDLLQLDADLLTMMRIGDHHKDAIFNHVLVFRSGIWPYESDYRQFLDEFTPRDRNELSRQRQ